MGGEIIDANDINNVLDRSRFSIIQGTGGIGKSTLLKHFFIDELKKNDLIPLFFELRNLEMNKEGLLHTLYDTLHNLGFKLEFEYFQYALKSGVFLILLDGYDELTEEKAKIFTRDIDGFCDMFGENYFIMTSRPTSEFIHFQRFSVFDACPFSKEQAISLIDKLEYEGEVKARFVEELDSRLYDRHTSFASVPLLLNMMFLTYDDYAEIPDKIHIFYSNAFETMYQKHDATKGAYRREMKSRLSYDDFKSTFAKFCFISYMKGMLEFTEDELNDLIKRSNTSEGFDAHGFICDLKDALCVIILEGTRYVFVHRSFQEYFSAFFLKEMDDASQSKYALKILAHGLGQLGSVPSMLFEMSQERFEKNIILPILKDIEEGENQDKYRLYLSVLADEIVMHKEGQGGQWEIGIAVRNMTILFRALVSIAYKYTTFEKYSRSEHLTDNYLSNKGYENVNQLKFSYEDICADVELLDVVEKSWIGERARFFANWASMLTEKHKDSFDSLEDLLDS